MPRWILPAGRRHGEHYKVRQFVGGKRLVVIPTIDHPTGAIQFTQQSGKVAIEPTHDLPLLINRYRRYLTHRDEYV
jgi:hypothetical protein